MSSKAHGPAASHLSRSPRPQFGDISKEIERRRVEWVQGYLQKSDYQFGDLTQKFVRDITGKDDYQVRVQPPPPTMHRTCSMAAALARLKESGRLVSYLTSLPLAVWRFDQERRQGIHGERRV